MGQPLYRVGVQSARAADESPLDIQQFYTHILPFTPLIIPTTLADPLPVKPADFPPVQAVLPVLGVLEGHVTPGVSCLEGPGEDNTREKDPCQHVLSHPSAPPVMPPQVP